MLAERFVAGMEVAVAVVHDGGEPRALPPVEVEAVGGVLRLHRALHARRRAPSTARPGSTPRRSPRWRRPRSAAHQLLGLRDVSRTDAIVDAAGRVQILEVNVSPGLTETSLLPIAAADRRDWSWASSTPRSSSAPSTLFHVKHAVVVSRDSTAALGST